MKTFKSSCGCEIHVIKWSAKANSVTTKFCPVHLAAPDLLEACKWLMEQMDSGYLVRDISHDHEDGWAMKAANFVMGLKKVQAALDKAEDDPAGSMDAED